MTPVDGHPRKTPFPGYLWKQRATANVAHVIQDFTEVSWVVGHYHHIGVGWALGQDRRLALDRDGAPGPWWAALTPTLSYKTARGEHLVYEMPDGRTIGNSTARFPDQGWGELRGDGGYVVIAAWDRPGLSLPLAPIAPFPRPEWLTDAGTPALRVSGPAAVAWQDAHATPLDTGVSEQKLRGFQSALAAWDGRTSRHDHAMKIAPWMAREAAAGLVSAPDAFRLLWEWWTDKSDDPGRKRRTTPREIASIIQTAIGYADAEPERVADLTDQVFGAAVASGEPTSFTTFHSTAGGGQQIVADLGDLGDGRFLFHLERFNLIHGDSGSGKSWLAVHLLAECIRANRMVVLLDYEDTAAVTGARLRQIGVSQSEQDRWLRVAHPDEPTSTPGLVAELVERYVELGVRHVVLDSWGEALALDGADEDRDLLVAAWVTRLVRPLGAVGIGTTVIDHITKTADNVLFPSGTKRKRAAITGVDWYLYSTTPFDRVDGGRSVLRCAKDRHGQFRRGDDVADLVMGPLDVVVGASTLELRPLAPAPPPSTSVRVDLMVEAVNIVVGEGKPMNKESILAAARSAGVKFKSDALRGAVELAVVRGFLAKQKGPRNSVEFVLIRPVPAASPPQAHPGVPTLPTPSPPQP